MIGVYLCICQTEWRASIVFQIAAIDHLISTIQPTAKRVKKLAADYEAKKQQDEAAEDPIEVLYCLHMVYVARDNITVDWMSMISQWMYMYCIF